MELAKSNNENERISTARDNPIVSLVNQDKKNAENKLLNSIYELKLPDSSSDEESNFFEYEGTRISAMRRSRDVCLNKDLYAISFFFWFKFNKKNYFFICQMIAIQIFLTTLLLVYLSTKQAYLKLSQISTILQITRIITSVLIVLSLNTEIKSGIQLVILALKFRKYEKKNELNYGIFCGFFQALIGFFCNIVCFLLIMKSENVVELIMDFTALAVITQLDEWMADEMDFVQDICADNDVGYLEVKWNNYYRKKCEFIANMGKVIIILYFLTAIVLEKYNIHIY